jgi:hypothetical protein
MSTRRPRDLARTARRTLLVLVLLVVAGACVPLGRPMPSDSPVWQETATLAGHSPTDEHDDRGSAYPSIGAQLLDLAFGTDLAGHPAGAVRSRTFTFDDLATAREAARQAIAAGQRHGFAMQPLDSFGSLAPNERSDGHSDEGDGTFTVHLLLSAEHTAPGTATVQLVLDGGY